MKRFISVLVAVITVAMAGAAMAATATNNLQVTASAISNCRIDSVTNVAFGNYDPTSASDNTAGSGSIVLRCTKGTTYWTYVAGTRQMTDGTNNLNFELYSDSGRSSVYASTKTGGGATASNNSAVTSNIYGKVTAQQDVPAGSYSATLTATVEY